MRVKAQTCLAECFPLQLPAPIRHSQGTQALPGLGLRRCPCRAPVRLGACPRNRRRWPRSRDNSAVFDSLAHGSRAQPAPDPPPPSPCRAGVELGVPRLPSRGGGFCRSLPITDSIRSQTRPHLHRAPSACSSKNHYLGKKEKEQQLASRAHRTGESSGWSRVLRHHFPQRLLCTGTSSGHPSLPPCASLPGRCWPRGKAALRFLGDSAARAGTKRLGSGGDATVPPPARCSPQPGQERGRQGSLGRIGIYAQEDEPLR